MNGPMNRRGRAGGFTLIEVVISMTVLVLALMGMVSVIVHTTRHNAVNRENQAAMRAAEKKIEEMVNRPFDTVLAAFSSTAGGNPGPDFDVPSLISSGAPAKVGKVRFPVNGAGQLVEVGTGAFLGMPADLDLDGNGIAGESTSVSATYQILPLEIQMNWKGVHGVRTLTYRHILFKK